MNAAYFYLPPILLLAILGAMVWAVRKIRRLTKSDKQASRLEEQRLLSSLGVVPSDWKDEAADSGGIDAAPVPPLAETPASDALAAEPAVKSPSVPWKMPPGSMMPPAPPLRRNAPPR